MSLCVFRIFHFVVALAECGVFTLCGAEDELTAEQSKAETWNLTGWRVCCLSDLNERLKMWSVRKKVYEKLLWYQRLLWMEDVKESVKDEKVETLSLNAVS